jgi:hypothetical protein
MPCRFSEGGEGEQHRCDEGGLELSFPRQNRDLALVVLPDVGKDFNPGGAVEISCPMSEMRAPSMMWCAKLSVDAG